MDPVKSDPNIVLTDIDEELEQSSSAIVSHDGFARRRPSWHNFLSMLTRLPASLCPLVSTEISLRDYRMYFGHSFRLDLSLSADRKLTLCVFLQFSPPLRTKFISSVLKKTKIEVLFYLVMLKQ